MSTPWWGKESRPGTKSRMVSGPGPLCLQPELHPERRADIFSELRSRVDAFTPDWTNLRPDDAGVALVHLFSEQTAPILRRLNRLPEKTFVEFLRTAGVQPIPARSARVILKFTASDAATQSIPVGQGFQVSGQAADDSGEMVIFETESNLYVAPVEIAESYLQEADLFLEVDVSGGDATKLHGGFRPFGSKPRIGSALVLGLSGDVVPGPSLSLYLQVSTEDGTPPPFASGGVAALPVPPPPLLRWEIFDGGRFEAVEIIRDETHNLTQSGVVELRVPRQWNAGRPPGLPGNEPLRWLHLRMAYGQYDVAPILSSIHLNMVPAIAARTFRNEVLEHVPGSRMRRMRLSQTPVLHKSLTLVVEEGEETGQRPAESEGPEESIPAGPGQSWKEVDNLMPYGPEDRVYVLDSGSGEILFGDGEHGKALPQGFRHVQALAYKVGGGLAGAVQAEDIDTLVNSTPFLTGVINPFPASGGSNRESRRDTMYRGPQQIRARNRAVTTADYALMALQAPGAEVKRAHAVAGLHPSYPGAPIPGVVAVFLLAPDRAIGPPFPDDGTLRAVSHYLSRKVAPLGVDVVAAAPHFHTVRVRTSVEIAPEADVGATVRRALEELDDYFDPLKGGEDGQGWPFGGPIRYAALVRRLLNRIPAVRAIVFLNLIVDGMQIAACADHEISPHGLIWATGHEVIPVSREAKR